MSTEIVKYWVWGDDFVCNIANLKAPIENSKPYNGEQFIKPIYNPQTNEVYEGATPEEIDEFNKSKIPQTARSMNFRLVLIQNGISMQSIYDLIASLPNPQNELAYQMFEYATHYDRNNAMLNQLADLMGISQSQLDDYFVQAENLVV